MKRYLSIDVGGSSIKYGLLNEDGCIIEHYKKKAPNNLEEMYKIFEEAYAQFEQYDIKGIALSMPGAVNSQTGIIGGSSAYDFIHGPNIKEDLQKRLNVQVELENDANCAALAEVWKGSAKDVEDCCFIVSGTGIGGALVKNKKIHHGTHLHGGEYGYMISEFNYDSLKMKTWSDNSTVNILKQIANEKGVDFSSLNSKEVFDHYRDDPILEKYIDKYYYAMAKGIHNLQYAYDPQKIIIGGAISERDDILYEIQKRLEVIYKHFPEAHIRPTILTCTFHNEANLIGALYHFLTIKND